MDQYQPIFGDSTLLQAQEISNSINTSVLSLSGQSYTPGVSQIVSSRQYIRIQEQILKITENPDPLVPDFYNPYKRQKMLNNQFIGSPYYVQYLQWKQKQSMQSSKKKDWDEGGNDWEISQSDILLQRQLDRYELNTHLRQRNQQKSYQEMRMKLQKISQQYKQKVSCLVKKKEFMEKKQQFLKPKNKFQYYHVDYTEFYKSRRPQAQQNSTRVVKDRNKSKQKSQMLYTTFVNLIKHPPRNNRQITDEKDKIKDQVPIPDLESSFGSEQGGKINWKLDIEQILKIPDPQFLLFYQQNQRKIVGLASPDELKLINRKRKEALDKQESLQKLKKKLAASGDRILSKLPPEKKKQLFQLLYENQLEEEIEKLSNSL